MPHADDILEPGAVQEPSFAERRIVSGAADGEPDASEDDGDHPRRRPTTAHEDAGWRALRPF